MKKADQILVTIKDIKPFGLVVQADNQNEGFVFERDISDFYICDLTSKFQKNEKIYVVKKECSEPRRPSYSYKVCHPIEQRKDPLYMMLLSNVESEIDSIKLEAKKNK